MYGRHDLGWMCRWREADFEKQLEQTKSPAVSYGDKRGDRQMAF